MKLNTFQLVLLVVCGFGALFAMLVFGRLIPAPGRSSQSGQVSLTVWGTAPRRAVEAVANRLRHENDTLPLITYREIPEADFHATFLEALANGGGPDLVIIPHTLVAADDERLTTVSFEQFPERTFLDTFAAGGALYRRSTGYIGFPLYADPLVLYYNRDRLAEVGLPQPPKTWTELLTVLSPLTTVTPDKAVTASAIPLGSFANIANAKAIFSLLLLQAGTPITAWTTIDGYVGRLSDQIDQAIAPTGSAIAFWNQFADPTAATYTWSSALPEAKNAFAGGTTALYLGFASELGSLREKNPHLNFDAALAPQRETGNRLVFGTIYGVSIARSAANQSAAAAGIGFLTSRDFVDGLAQALGLAPLRSDLLAAGASDPFQAVFYRSALYTRGWIDPNPAASAGVIRTMVENVATGRLSTADAVAKANQELTKLF